MKKPQVACTGIVFVLGLMFILHAQEMTQDGGVSLTATNDVSALSDFEVELMALEQTTPLPATAAPDAGNFYSTQHLPGSEDEWPPLPANIRNTPVWPLGEGFYLLDDSGVDYDAPAAGSGLRAMSLSRLSDFGDGLSPDFAPLDLVSSTNLWLAITNLANSTAGLMLSNTIADIQYEIQGTTNLSDANWISEGFVLGSEITNWTAASVAATNYPNLFLRVRSWQDSDGSGLPDWWQLQYFGTTGIDPNGDPMGDGWSNIQKFQNGMNPNVFYTPPAPQGLTVTYNSANGTATVTWLPSSGAVTGYTVETPNGNFSVSSSTYTFVDTNLPTAFSGDQFFDGGTIFGNYNVYADYPGGNSTLSDAAPLEPNSLPVFSDTINFVAGPQGSAYLAARNFPSGAKAVRLKRYDNYGETFGDDSFDTNMDFPVTDFTNGLCLLPASVAFPPQGYAGQRSYYWWVQLVYSNGDFSAAQTWFDPSGNNPYFGFGGCTELDPDFFPVPPYIDGRQQLKQNLIFLLRAATVDSPFYFLNFDGGSTFGYTNTSSYAYSGFYQFDGAGFETPGTFSVLEPFRKNAMYRNFVFNPPDIDSNGRLTTGASGSYYNYSSDAYDPADAFILTDPVTYQFDVPTTSGTTFASLLATNDTQWLGTYPFDSPDSYLGEIGISTNGAGTYSLAGNAHNWFGLKFLSAKIGYSSGTTVLSAGGNTTQGGYFYPETEQPKFQTMEYDFWNTSWANSDSVPGSPDFSPTNNNQLLIASVGNQHFQVACYAKLAVTNSFYSGVYGYLGQYFDRAYEMTNGVVTTNTTGVLSSYGQFFATEPGPTALVTMPDIDTGERGTCTVYAVSLQLDANHDGNMDLNFSGADATSQANPDQIWVNNNYDRWKFDLLGVTYEQDDTKIATVPDSQYTTNGVPAIPCPRDLEDYFRLWTPGVAALMKALPSNYTVQLTLSGSGRLRIFQALEPNGGTNYLFDETTASNQVANASSLYVGLLTSSSPIVFTIQTNFDEHFIFCGVTSGSVQIDLQVLDGSLNVVADAPAYLQINDIKQMYERWTVGDTTTQAPLNVAITAKDGLQVGASPFQYTPPQDTNMPYILFVHGWNMEAWEKDRFAETTFKRLYWQGYQGRFGSFRWPTYADFPLGSWSWSAIDPRNFDKSESNAWASATGLLNKLNDLNALYPNNVYLIAHSMGNVVAGEALRLAGTNQVVNTYIAMQGAIASHAYDSTTPTRSLGVADSGTPDCYANYYTNGAPCYFNSSAGAGAYVNFFNTNDWALVNLWEPDQSVKPDNASPDFPGYFYSTPSGTHPSGFYKIVGSTDINFSFPGDTYTIFAFCDEARSHALGSQINVGGVFKTLTYNQVELDIAPYGFGGNHVDHSGEFRSDNPRRWQFWNQTLVQMGLKH